MRILWWPILIQFVVVFVISSPDLRGNWYAGSSRSTCDRTLRHRMDLAERVCTKHTGQRRCTDRRPVPPDRRFPGIRAHNCRRHTCTRRLRRISVEAFHGDSWSSETAFPLPSYLLLPARVGYIVNPFFNHCFNRRQQPYLKAQGVKLHLKQHNVFDLKNDSSKKKSEEKNLRIVADGPAVVIWPTAAVVALPTAVADALSTVAITFSRTEEPASFWTRKVVTLAVLAADDLPTIHEWRLPENWRYQYFYCWTSPGLSSVFSLDANGCPLEESSPWTQV